MVQKSLACMLKGIVHQFGKHFLRELDDKIQTLLRMLSTEPEQRWHHEGASAFCKKKKKKRLLF